MYNIQIIIKHHEVRVDDYYTLQMTIATHAF